MLAQFPTKAVQCNHPHHLINLNEVATTAVYYLACFREGRRDTPKS